MKGYERLTDKDIEVTLNCNAFEDNTRFFCYAHRLWELENKIESGEIDYVADKDKEIARLTAENAELKARLEKGVELPCKVGDTVYDIYSDEIRESKIRSISLVIYKDSICWSIHCVQGERTLYFSDTTYNSLWFTDRAKAEAELKGGDQE